MGAFDEITYKGEVYQTKSFPAPWQDRYEVRDGQLWKEEYDIEDQSDPNAKGVARLFGMMTPVNRRWVPYDFTDTVYVWRGPTMVFEHGKLVEVREWNESEYNTNS